MMSREWATFAVTSSVGPSRITLMLRSWRLDSRAAIDWQTCCSSRALANSGLTGSKSPRSLFLLENALIRAAILVLGAKEWSVLFVLVMGSFFAIGDWGAENDQLTAIAAVLFYKLIELPASRWFRRLILPK